MTKVITKAITPEFTNSEIPQSFFHGEQGIYILNEAAYLQIERVIDMLRPLQKSLSSNSRNPNTGFRLFPPPPIPPDFTQIPP